MKKLVTPLLKKISILALLTLSLLTLSNCKKNLQEQTKPESNLVTRQISEQSAKLSKQDELLLDSIYNSYEYSKIAEIANKTQAFIAKMQEYTDKNFDKKQSKYRTSKQDFDDNLNYDLDKVSKEVLDAYIEVGKFYTDKYIIKLSNQFPSIINNKKVQKKLIAKINKFINPSQVKSNGKSSRVKIDIVAEIGKTIDPNTYCQSRGLWFDAVLNSCVNWTYGGGKYTGGGTPYGAGRDGGSGPIPPSSWSDGLYGKDGYTVIRPSTYLIELLSITDPSLINYLNGNQTISDDLVAYLDINGYTIENEEFIIWGIQSLSSGYLSFEEFESEYLTNFDNPIDAPDVSKINNGIEIIDADTPPPPSSQLKLIGSTTDRHNTEDLTYGFDGNTDGLKKTYLFNYSNDQLFDEMKGVLDIGSTFGLRDVTTYF